MWRRGNGVYVTRININQSTYPVLCFRVNIIFEVYDKKIENAVFYTQHTYAYTRGVNIIRKTADDDESLKFKKSRSHVNPLHVRRSVLPKATTRGSVVVFGTCPQYFRQESFSPSSGTDRGKSLAVTYTRGHIKQNVLCLVAAICRVPAQEIGKKHARPTRCTRLPTRLFFNVVYVLEPYKKNCWNNNFKQNSSIVRLYV